MICFVIIPCECYMAHIWYTFTEVFRNHITRSAKCGGLVLSRYIWVPSSAMELLSESSTDDTTALSSCPLPWSLARYGCSGAVNRMLGLLQRQLSRGRRKRDESKQHQVTATLGDRVKTFTGTKQTYRLNSPNIFPW